MGKKTEKNTLEPFIFLTIFKTNEREARVVRMGRWERGDER